MHRSSHEDPTTRRRWIGTDVLDAHSRIGLDRVCDHDETSTPCVFRTEFIVKGQHGVKIRRLDDKSLQCRLASEQSL